jgi:hypothetical protein
MSTVEHSDGNQGIFTSERSILAFTRDNACWHCEKPLPPAFCGVRAFIPPNDLFKYPILFLTCLPICQRRVLAELQPLGLWTEVWDPLRIRRFLDDPENITGTLQDINLGQILKANRG